MHDAGTSHGNTGARTASHIAIGLSGIGCGLLIAHANIVDAFLLRRSGNRANRETDDTKQMVYALLFKTSCDQGRTRDLTHFIYLQSDT